ncbi:ATP-dependent helicase [Clostridium polynesiense]|uniref:ATP-dependent helicase n=1 Tax=Clostridium polynesiense TaxID=1325933 RepID=UPI00058FE3BE|nr:ATP-dependent helicase [Clostridium polynesiense]
MSLTLDECQIEAVRTNKDKVLVVAAPGSGKTTVIVNRVYYLMKELKVSKDNIIVITFTRAAAQNMKERFQRLWKGEGVPFFGTFHGLFYKILKRHKGDINIISPSAAYSLIDRSLQEYMDEVGEDKVRDILNSISLFKCSGSSIEAFNSSMDKEVFISCLKNYEAYKAKNKLWDFDDIQIETKKLFQEDKSLLSKYRNLFKHILVDEFQDCDYLQIQLIKMLCEKSSLFSVGDEDQCIYAFRGSNPQCMVNFQKHFEKGIKYFLDYNYRSAENIVECSKSLIKHNKERYEKNIKAFRKDSGRVNVNYVYNEVQQAESVVSEIISAVNKGMNYGDNAVLFRTNKESRNIIDAFIRKKIPFILLDKEYNFFEHFICRDILSYLRLSIDCKDRESFCCIINKPFRYVSKSSILEVKSHMYSTDCFEILKSIKDIPVFQIKNIERLQKDIAYLNKISLNSAINTVLMELGYIDYLKEYSTKYKVPFEELEELLEEFIEAASEYKSILTFLSHVEEYTAEIKNSTKKNKEDSVILSTIHGVKGMEFNNVHIINCNEENIPHKNSLKDGIEEERRLFYVGVTRAVNALNLYAPKKILGKEKEVSRFLKESSFRSSSSMIYPYKVNETIYHKYFKQGSISKINDNVIEIKFNDGISRQFDIDVLMKNKLIEKI